MRGNHSQPLKGQRVTRPRLHLLAHNSFFRWKNLRRYMSWNTAEPTHTASETMLNQATRVLVSSAAPGNRQRAQTARQRVAHDPYLHGARACVCPEQGVMWAPCDKHFFTCAYVYLVAYAMLRWCSVVKPRMLRQLHVPVSMYRSQAASTYTARYRADLLSQPISQLHYHSTHSCTSALLTRYVVMLRCTEGLTHNHTRVAACVVDIEHQD